MNRIPSGAIPKWPPILFGLALLMSCSGLATEDVTGGFTAATAKRLEAVGLKDCSRVVAFALNVGQESPLPTHLVVIGGSLNPNRSPIQGVSLNDRQVAKFLDATATRPFPAPRGRCFYPRHGFVFLGPDGDIVSHYTVSLDCGGYEAGQGAFTPEPDFKALRALLRSLGVAGP